MSDLPTKPTISDEQRARLERLAAKPDADIDTTDIPEVQDWSDAVRGGLYKPRKQTITIRVDADLLDWFESHAPDGKGYQSEINRVLRRHVAAVEKPRA